MADSIFQYNTVPSKYNAGQDLRPRTPDEEYEAELEAAKRATRESALDEIRRARLAVMNAGPLDRYKQNRNMGIMPDAATNSIGVLFARQMEYDKLKALANNPKAQLDLLTTGVADVSAPRISALFNDRNRFDEQVAQRGLDQLEYDLDGGRFPAIQDLRKQAVLNERNRSSKGTPIDTIRNMASDAVDTRTRLLESSQPRPTQYSVPDFLSEPERQSWPGDVRPIRRSTTVSRDRRSLIPSFTNY